jgi:hypothetical protein
VTAFIIVKMEPTVSLVYSLFLKIITILSRFGYGRWGLAISSAAATNLRVILLVLPLSLKTKYLIGYTLTWCDPFNLREILVDYFHALLKILQTRKLPPLPSMLDGDITAY